MNKLSKFQRRAFKIFDDKGFDVDVPIKDVYEVLYGKNTLVAEVRTMQQLLGPLFARINDKLIATHIIPGNLKQTYRIARRPKV